MQPIPRLLLPALAGFSLCCATARADVLLDEPFDYPVGSKLVGAAGGTGSWNGPWNVSDLIPSATITAKGLSFGDGTVNPSAAGSTRVKAARREFIKYFGDIVYVKFTFSLGAGTTTDPDRFGLFLPNDEHGALLIGTGLNGSGSEVPSNTISARVFDNSKHRVAPQLVLSTETPYTVVAEWSKSVPGASSPYNRLRMWIEPKPEDVAGATHRELNYKELRPSMNTIGFFIADSDPGDVFNVRHIKVATTWQEIMAP